MPQCSRVRSSSRVRSRFCRALAVLSLILTAAAGVILAAAATVPSHFVVLHAFASPGAINPSASLIQATDGNFYGTTSSGGPSDSGTVFRMTPSGTVTVLHAFAGGTTDGAEPQAALIQATDGNFYGTTSSGGPSDNGTVFQMTPGGTVTVLHAFAGGTTDGANPTAALIQATDGNFYGTTSSGGTSTFFGTVFKMTPGGALTILYSFTDGFTGGVPGAPYASLIQATDGNFYGTTVADQGIHVAYGAIFKMTPDGTATVLNGLASYASLIQGTDGNFYGTTISGLLSPQDWTAFKMTPSGTVTILASNVGAGQAALIQAADGDFYGTSGGGAFNSGTAFQMTPSGSINVLHAFTGGADGANPGVSLIQATDGGFYGTTYSGGASGTGVVFRLSPRVASDGDFDGDGKADIAVYRPSTGGWYVLWSSTNYTT